MSKKPIPKQQSFQNAGVWRATPETARPPVPHVAQALGRAASDLAHRRGQAVQPAAGGHPPLTWPQGRSVRSAVAQRSESEWEDNPGFWYTGERLSIKDFLYADCHMLHSGSPPVEALTFNGIQGAIFDLFTGKGSILKIQYRFGNWNVFVPWPTVWCLLGGDYYPLPNRYGFAPSAEFGNPTFNGETSTRTDLKRVQPFVYAVKKGKYTPEVDFIFDEPISPSVFRQLASEAKKNGVKQAVEKLLKR
jgi:hypothetical protein